MAWTSLAEEAALLESLAQQHPGRVAVDVVGQSVAGRPVRLVRLGAPVHPVDRRAAVLLVGCQHGDEPAGREALLTLIQDLATTESQALLDFLAEWPVLVMPTANPDGFQANRRVNENGVNLNQDHTQLTQPETRAIAFVLGRARPLVVYDGHDSVQSEDLRVLGTTTAEVPSRVAAHSQAICQAFYARAAAEDWTIDDFPGSANERVLRNIAGLRYGAGVLVETSHGMSDEHRATVQEAMVAETLAYTVANVDTILDDALADEADRIAAGVTGAAFDLGSTVLDPAPLGYRLTGSQAAALTFHLDVFGIARTGPSNLIVPMAQAAQPVIPFLLDPDAAFGAAAATRLYELPTVIPVATVQEFAQVVHGSHTVLIEAMVVREFTTGPEPEGVPIPVLGGEVIFDATADVLAMLDLEVAGVDPETGRPWFPRRPVDLLAPFGNEIFVRRGVDLGAGAMWSPLGYFRITAPGQSDAPDGPIRIDGADRMAGIVEAKLIWPIQFSAETTHGEAVARLVRDVFPDAVIAWDDSDAELAPLGRQLVVEEDRYAALRDLAESLGKLVWWDGEGILRVADAPDATVPVWHVPAGRHGVLVSAQRRVTREGIFNAVVAQGEATSGTPARAVMVDEGPRSPTRWGGPFGKVPRFYSSPLLTDGGQAAKAAASILRRSIGMPYSVDLGAIPNPALRPHDPIRVTLRDGSRDLHIVDTVSIPLTAGGGPMRLSTRSMADVRLGEL